MAKPKKQKPEEQPKPAGDNSVGMSVLHQKLCLSIDMDKRMVHGYTELKIIVQEGQNVALHADNMAITQITVNGEPAEFEYSSHHQVNEDDNKFCLLSCSQAASEVACSVYMSSLDKERVPNLLIACNNLAKSNQQQMDDNGKNIVEICSGEQIVNGHNGQNGHPAEKNVMVIHIDYHLERAETGIHFVNNVLHTDNQIRRSHCWFPCAYGSHQCTFDLEYTVNSNFVAVSNGDLLYQVLGKTDPSCKTYVYKLTSPVTAEWISLTVAPFEILPDSHNAVISHMCLSPSFSMLQNTVGFFHNVFSHYEDYLSTCFPFGSYKQMFLPEEITVSPINFGASTCVFSSHLLFDDKVIDQTIETRIKLAYALARQWFGVYITAEEPTDEWLIDGLAGFLTDTYVKRFLGNNEARYRRFKANAAVCKSDITGATALSSSAATTDIYGTHVIGFYGKIRLWKAIAVLQMLEKQMGPECFRKILQNILHKVTGRTLSSKEFRHLANKIGNLERPFLKEFFPRWVESCGCPIMRTGLSYNKRRNIIELAVIRGCTMKTGSVSGRNADNETREGDSGWPGMMSIRVHELDGMYDHPILPMAGENWQLLEIQCHSKLAAKRFQKPKKGSKPDGSDDNADTVPTQDVRNGVESPLLWVRVDPEMEYLAEIHFHQPVQMWVNQLEKDKDVIAQSQAISMLEKLPQLSFTVINALNNFLSDSKAYWRVRIEAAYALAHTTTEETDLAGLLHLVKFYKSRRFDAEIGLPRPNDFRDVQEYFVLEAIPHAIALVRAADRKSPREAIEFVLQLLKYNDNNGNPYSDVYWLAALVQSVGELEFGQQGIFLLSSLLKRIDRLMQFDSLMPSYNRVLTVTCIRTLAQIALKMSNSLLLDRVYELIKPFRNIEKASWKVRIEASRVLLDLEFHGKGLNAALCLFIIFLDEESSLRGEIKLAAHAMHLCQINTESQLDSQIASPTLVALLRLLEGRKGFNNVLLRHYLFAILQMLAGRSPTLYGAPKVQVETTIGTETHNEQQTKPAPLKLKIPRSLEPPMYMPNSSDAPLVTETAKDADTVSASSERKNVVKIRVRQSASSGRTDGQQTDYSRGGLKNTELGPCSPVSVDAPARGTNEQLNVSNQNMEDVNSCHDLESRMTMSIGSAKFVNKGDTAKEFQCTADSKQGILAENPLSPSINMHVEDNVPLGTASSQAPCAVNHDREEDKVCNDIQEDKVKKEKKDKDKKRKRDDKTDKKDDPEYLERKRLKKAKKKLEKELAKKQKLEERNRDSKNSMLPELSKDTSIIGGESKKVENGDTQTSKAKETTSETTQGSLAPKVRIRFKSRALGNI